MQAGKDGDKRSNGDVTVAVGAAADSAWSRSRKEVDEGEEGDVVQDERLHPEQEQAHVTGKEKQSSRVAEERPTKAVGDSIGILRIPRTVEGGGSRCGHGEKRGGSPSRRTSILGRKKRKRTGRGEVEVAGKDSGMVRVLQDRRNQISVERLPTKRTHPTSKAGINSESSENEFTGDTSGSGSDHNPPLPLCGKDWRNVDSDYTSSEEEEGVGRVYERQGSPRAKRKGRGTGTQRRQASGQTPKVIRDFQNGVSRTSLRTLFGEMRREDSILGVSSLAEHPEVSLRRRCEAAKKEFDRLTKQQYTNVDEGSGEAFSGPMVTHLKFHRPASRTADPLFTVFFAKEFNERTKRWEKVKPKLNATLQEIRETVHDGFLENCLRFGYKLTDKDPEYKPNFKVPVGDSNFDVAPDSCLVKKWPNGQDMKKLRFHQGHSNWCLAFSFANALHHLKMYDEANNVKLKGESWSSLPVDMQLKRLLDHVNVKVRKVTMVSKVHNVLQHQSSISKVVKSLRDFQLVLLIPKGHDGMSAHAVTYCNGMLFDPTQRYPLKPTEESFDFICGSCGCAGISQARLFNVKK